MTRLTALVPTLCAVLVPLLAGCATEAPVDMEAVANSKPFYTSTNPATSRTVEEFRSTDGSVLGYVSHKADNKAAVIYLHGIESHAGWFDEAADLVCARGYDVLCLDRRGSGINRENRGFPSGDLDSMDTLLADVHAFVEHVRPAYERVFLVGLSWGGKLAMAHALVHPEDTLGVAMITPGIRAEVGASFGTKVEGFFGMVFQPRSLLEIPIEPEMFTKVPETLEWIKQDPLRLHYASVRFFLASDDLEDLIDEKMTTNRLPLLLILAGKDEIIDNEGVIAALEGGGEGTLKILTYEDQTHSIQFDAPERLAEDLVSWLDRIR